MEYIQATTQGFTYAGNAIRLRGFGIGTWLNLEHFMLGIPTSEQRMKQAFEEEYGEETASEFLKKYRDSFFNENDFKILKEAGVNFIRVPFNYRLWINDNDTDHYLEDGFFYFDRLFTLCKKYEIFAMIDLHSTPGGQNPDWHSDNSNGVSLFWEYQIFRRQITKLWQVIAKRYEAEPFLMGYDLINEPAMVRWDVLNEFYKETIEAIRLVDKNHVIVLEGSHFSMDFSGLAPLVDKQCAISFHYYPTVWHPDLLEDSMSSMERKKKIKEGLLRLLKVKEHFACPVFCGEFGYGADCGDPAFTLGLLKDTLDLFEEENVDWLLWCYKDARFMSMVFPKKDSGWMKLASAIQNEWSQEIEKQQAFALLEKLKEDWFFNLTKEEEYLLQFRFRASFYLLQKNHILLPQLNQITAEQLLDMAMDFSAERCEVSLDIKNLLKTYL